MKTQKYLVLMITVLFIVGGSSSCSIKKMAIKQVANALTAPGGSTVFTGDNDPELVGDALPFAIKMYESLLVSAPNHRGLQLVTGSLYVMYANAFLQTPAGMLTEDEYEEQEFLLKRAKNLFIRGRDILLKALDKKHPGFLKQIHGKKYKEAVRPMKHDDIELLYWAGAGWMGAFSIDPFDMEIGITLPRAAALMDKVMVLNPNYGDGAIHDFFILYYGSLPEYMGGNLKLAREHFEKAEKLSQGKSGSSYISLATTVSVKNQDHEEFSKLLKKVLEIDPEADPDNRLINTLNRRKALWLLDHIGDYFLLDDEDEAEDSK
ncbi:MAG: TRAP transporter TatT component family protein [Candidatus Aminicenantes bacterium]|nr:TRAP transporter TatT component family protein [Candidatus Aminicenantes bacterium]